MEGSIKWEDCGPCRAGVGKKQDPISKITRAKKGWSHNSKCRAPEQQAGSSEFKLEYQEKRRKRKKERERERER
jgi:hypothetical protein